MLGFNFNSEDVYLSYVPLSHVYEHIMHINSLIHSFQVGYSTDRSNLLDDIARLKPTFFGSFPAFYNRIFQKIKEAIRETMCCVSAQPVPETV